MAQGRPPQSAAAANKTNTLMIIGVIAGAVLVIALLFVTQQQNRVASLAGGSEFLAQNALEEGVITLPSGLQYKVIEEGTGARPTLNDSVTVHYRGTLTDGTEFDSSFGGEPITFPLRNVIQGWQEGLQLMTVGSRYMLYIPSELGYGARGTPGGPIPPNATLIFEVELLGIG
ncbi:FKBP-type peptidyl-prolyl cis-trans isomerase [Anaerolineae bacterium CFX9]|jgi:FKBP-type peptidyl-prolyl cis-trans isomerase|nr:FKBP-type peptidyl-prolyl cis-trans isomerase [Anaerolineae bacterium CFX9]